MYISSWQLLDRKNNELEDLRSEHHLKVAQLEAQNQRLEMKLSQLERDHTHLQEIREMEVTDSRNSSQHLRQQLQADFDKKVFKYFLFYANKCMIMSISMPNSSCSSVVRAVDWRAKHLGSTPRYMYISSFFS